MPLPRLLLLPAPAEPFPGWVDVHEVPGLLGGHLLVLHRSVLLWAETPAPQRGGLFRQEGEDDAAGREALAPTDELREALRVLGKMRRAPERERPAAVGRACDAVSAWAERAGHPGTALAWARLSASAYPPNVAAAYRVGILARQRGDYATAEAWLQHAGSTGRKHGEWCLFVRAMNSLGNLHAQKGDLPLARATLSQALQAARRPRGRVQGGRERLRVLEGEVLHDLLGVTAQFGDLLDAERYAAESFRCLPTGHPRLPALAHDVGLLWTDLGRFSRALPVFQAVLAHIRDARDRLVVLGNLARCAGAGKREETFNDAWNEAWAIIQRGEIASVPAVVYTHLGRGAASLHRWVDAERCARIGAAAAEARHEADQVAVISSLTEAIRLHRYAEAPPRSSGPAQELAARVLADGLVEKLETMRAGE